MRTRRAVKMETAAIPFGAQPLFADNLDIHSIR